MRKKCSLKLRSRDVEEADGGNSQLGQIGKYQLKKCRKTFEYLEGSL